MKVIYRRDIKAQVSEAFEGICSEIDENRYNPSEPRAGTAPTDDAIDTAHGLLCDLITALGKEYGAVDMDKVNSQLTLDEIKETITLENAWKACDIEELEEIDRFSDNHGERKYRYDTAIYEYKPTGEFISIEIQKTADGEVDLSLGEIDIVEIKETTSYQWV